MKKQQKKRTDTQMVTDTRDSRQKKRKHKPIGSDETVLLISQSLSSMSLSGEWSCSMLLTVSGKDMWKCAQSIRVTWNLTFIPADQVEHAHDNPVDEITLGECNLTTSVTLEELPVEKPFSPKKMDLDIEEDSEVKCEEDEEEDASTLTITPKDVRKDQPEHNSGTGDLHESKCTPEEYSQVFVHVYLSNCVSVFPEVDQNRKQDEGETEEKKTKTKNKARECDSTQKTNKTTRSQKSNICFCDLLRCEKMKIMETVGYQQLLCCDEKILSTDFGLTWVFMDYVNYQNYPIDLSLYFFPVKLCLEKTQLLNL